MVVVAGQRYLRSDGVPGWVTVVDADKYADVGDVVVRCSLRGIEYRIDRFKLTVVRYYLEEDER